MPKLSEVTSDKIVNALRKLEKEGKDVREKGVQIAYAWLDAQNTVKSSQIIIQLKHCIERWAGQYVSEEEVEVAAVLHSRIEGKYPRYNLSKRLIEPSEKRLIELGEPLRNEKNSDKYSPAKYFRKELI